MSSFDIGQLAADVAALKATTTMILREIDRIWYVIVPVGVGIIITILQNILVHREVKRNNNRR